MRLRIGLGIWILAAGVAFEGQVRATSPHPEHGRPWLIAAALLGFAGMGLLGRAAPEHASEAADVSFEPLAIPHRRRMGGLAIMLLGGALLIVVGIVQSIADRPAYAG